MNEKLPLLAIPAVIYNLIAVLNLLGVSAAGVMAHPFVMIPMRTPMSTWPISLGDVLIFAGLICLFFEVIRATGTSNATLFNHSFSMLLFIVCFVEFLLLRPFATSTWFLLTSMMMLDVMAGFIVTAVAARKDIGFGG